MADLALAWDPAALAADLMVAANDLAWADGGLEEAVLLSLFLDRQAAQGDVLPSAETDRRGWFGDAVPVVANDQIGSRLWLLAREKQTQTLLARAEDLAREALAWLTEDRVASAVTVVASFPAAGAIRLLVTVARPNVDPVSYQYTSAWTALGG